jgi:hypothetical protein
MLGFGSVLPTTSFSRAPAAPCWVRKCHLPRYHPGRWGAAVDSGRELTGGGSSMSGGTTGGLAGLPVQVDWCGWPRSPSAGCPINSMP